MSQYVHWLRGDLLCTKCGKYKGVDEFRHYPHKINLTPRSGYTYHCIPCQLEYGAARRAITRDQSGYTELRRGYHVKSKYGISLEEYNAMLTRQSNSCAICKDEFTDTRLPRVDHNHKTKVVRGLLCHGCNTAIGHLKEDVTIMKAAIEYMEKDFSDFLSIMKGEL